MRIAIVTETWHPAIDGVVTRLSNTVEELSSRGHVVLIVAPRGGPARYAGALVRDLPAFRVPLLRWRPWAFPAPRIWRFLREFQPDVVHVVNPVFAGIAGAVAGRRLGLPVVVSYHAHIDRYASFYHLGWLAPLIRRVTRRLHDDASLSLATAEASCIELRGLGIAEVRLWRQGVDLDRFQPRRRTAASEGLIVCLYVGRLAPEKTLDRLATLTRAGSGARLVLVGDGPDRSRLEQLFAGTAVTFTGMLTGDELVAAYAEADVFVFPSTTDTLGLALLEALASGLPVLAADTLASREVLGGCLAARLFPAESTETLPQLARELVDSADRDSLARAARSHVEQWAWETATTELVDYYRQAIAAAASPAWTLPRHAGRRHTRGQRHR